MEQNVVYVVKGDVIDTDYQIVGVFDEFLKACKAMQLEVQRVKPDFTVVSDVSNYVVIEIGKNEPIGHVRDWDSLKIQVVDMGCNRYVYYPYEGYIIERLKVQ